MVGPPEVVAERYRLERVVSSASWGTLFAARDGHTDRTVFVGLAGKQADESFRHDARAAATLAHPTLARSIDHGDHSGSPFIVMEEADGAPMIDVLRGGERVPARRALRISVQILQALEHAHAAGLSHGDLDEGSVLVTEQDRVKVVGLGLGGRSGPRDDIRAAGRLLDKMLDPSRSTELREIIDRATGDIHPFRSATDMRKALEHVRVNIAPPDLDDAEETIRSEAPATVWPIPDRHYDPTRLGRRVIAAMVAVAVVALAAFLWRAMTRADELREERQEREESSSPSPASTSSSLGNLARPSSVTDTERVTLRGTLATPARTAPAEDRHTDQWSASRGIDAPPRGPAPEHPRPEIERIA